MQTLGAYIQDYDDARMRNFASFASITTSTITSHPSINCCACPSKGQSVRKQELLEGWDVMFFLFKKRNYVQQIVRKP